jgi:hemerythrin-like domain-containing protein
MLNGHSEGCELVAIIRDRFRAAEDDGKHAAASLKENLPSCVQLLRSRVDKENNMLLVMADNVLAAKEQQDLSKAFTKVEAEEIGEGIHEKYRRMAHRLAGA